MTGLSDHRDNGCLLLRVALASLSLRSVYIAAKKDLRCVEPGLAWSRSSPPDEIACWAARRSSHRSCLFWNPSIWKFRASQPLGRKSFICNNLSRVTARRWSCRMTVLGHKSFTKVDAQPPLVGSTQLSLILTAITSPRAHSTPSAVSDTCTVTFRAVTSMTLPRSSRTQSIGVGFR